MPSTPNSCLSPVNPLPPRVAGINYGVFFQDTSGSVPAINVPPNYLMWMSNNVPPDQNLGSAGDFYIMTTADSMVVYQKSNIWTAYTTLTGGIPVSLTGIYTTLTSLQNQINSIVASTGTVTSVSAGNLANLATVTVSTASTTPSISFSMTSATQGYVWCGGIPSGGPNYYSLASVIDANLGSTIGSIIVRGTSGWTVLNPGSSGYVLTAAGVGSAPSWSSVAGTGTVTGFSAGNITNFFTTGVANYSTTPYLTFTLNNVLNGYLWCNASGSTQPPYYAKLSDFLDAVFANDQGIILYRASGQWNYLYPGTSGQVLTTGGPSANPYWSSISGSGTVTSFSSGNLTPLFTTVVTSSTTTPSQTFSLTNAAGNTLFGNNTGSTTAPAYNTLTSYIDSAFGSAQGDILYRDSGAWKVLAPGTTGQLLQTQGASANPTWATISGSGTVTSFSSGSLSPLFTTSVTSSTTTPAQIFTLSNCSGGTIWGNSTSSTTTPGYNTISAYLDNASSSVGRGGLIFRSSSSWIGLSVGSSGQVLTSQGPGADLIWSSTGGGSLPLTTLGDMVYENSTPAPARLPGNTTAIRKFLTQTGTGSVSASPSWTKQAPFNVQDYGIVADSSTDQTSALNAMLALVPDYVTVYFPAVDGNFYRIDGPVNISSRDLFFLGDGSNQSRLQTQSQTTPMFIVYGGTFGMRGFNFSTTGSRLNGYPVVTISNCGNGGSMANYQDLFFGVQGDGLYLLDSAFYCINSQWQSNGSGGGLLLNAQSEVIMTNCIIRNSSNGKPAMWLRGAPGGATSTYISNCCFAGAGPLYSYAPSGVSSDGTTITVSLGVSPTGFYVNDYIDLVGMTSTEYNGFWRITSIGSTSIGCVGTPFQSVPSAGTGTVGGGIAETIPCVVQIDNVNGPYNESGFSNCQFASVSSPSAPLTASLYMQGTGSGYTLAGWQFNANYYDYGTAAVLLTGYASASPNIRAISLNGCMGNSPLAGFFISMASDVRVVGYTQNLLPKVSGTSCGAYVYSSGTTLSSGLTISDSDLGPSPVWNNISYSGYIPTYGIILDGQISSFMLSGNYIWGQTAPTLNVNSGSTSSTLYGGSGNLYLQGTSNPPTKVSTPSYFP